MGSREKDKKMERCNDEPNEMQNEMLKQFRRNISDILTPEYTDAILLKWLRATNYNLQKSEIRFRETRACRAVQLDAFVDCYKPPEVIEKYEFTGYVGTAKDGTPVRYIALGRGDVRGYVMSMTVHQICRYSSYVIESDFKRMREANKKSRKEINEITYIVDMECFSLRLVAYACVVEMGLDMIKLLQDYYPEIWRYILIVNAPSYFHLAFNLFRPILRHTLLQNVRVASRENSPQLLLRYIDADVLPAFLGGKRVDSKGNPMCKEFLKFGGTIPEEEYLRNLPPLLPSDEGAESFWIGPRSVYNYPFIVREAGSTFHVEMRSEGGSITANLLYREFGPDPTNLDLPSQDEYLDEHDERCNVKLCTPTFRAQVHLTPINDSSYAPWPGIYIIKFDNSYNWLTWRKIILRVRVYPPGSSRC